MRVLLVEDDEAVAESLTRGLGRYGFDVEWVGTGSEALRARIALLPLRREQKWAAVQWRHLYERR